MKLLRTMIHGIISFALICVCIPVGLCVIALADLEVMDMDDIM